MPLRESYEWEPLRVRQEWIDDLEEDCDRYNEQLTPLRSFILPGGTAGAAHLHVARTVARRAERAAWAALEAYGDAPAGADARRGEGGVNPLTAKYLNRLSDLLFILGRVANLSAGGDVLWQPGGGRTEAPEKRRRRGSTQEQPPA
jgi:cob(I)alamin adenosyltransferase